MHVSDSNDDRTVLVVDENARPAAPLRPYHVLALLPTIGLLGGVSFANRVEPYVLGLPFLLFWIVMWVVATSGIMAIITALDSAQPPETEGDRDVLVTTGRAAP